MFAALAPRAIADAMLVLAAGSAGLFFAAWFVNRRLSSASWMRTIWQAAVVALAGLAVCEFSGLGSVASALWMRRGATVVAGTMSGPETSATASVPLAERRAETEWLQEKPPWIVAPPAPPYEMFAFAERAETLPPHPAPSSNLEDIRAPAASTIETAPAPLTFEAATSPAWFWPALAALWLVGTLALGMRIIAGHWWLCRSRRRFVPTIDADLSRQVASVADRIGLRRVVRVATAEVAGPVAMGFWRPTLVLPAWFTSQFTRTQQEAVLAHELTHLAGHDPAWHLLADVVVAVYWWNPLVWWARAELRAACESAADEASLAVADGPGLLAECLVALGRRLRRPRRLGYVAMEGTGFRSSLGRRVSRLLGLQGKTWRPRRRWAGATVGATAPVIALLAVLFSTSYVRSEVPSTGEPTVKSLHSTWRHSLAGFVLCGLLGVGVPADAQDKAAGDDEKRDQRVERKDGPPRPDAERRDADARAEGQRREGDRPKEGERREGDRPAGERREGDRRPEGERRDAQRRPEGERRPAGERPDRPDAREAAERERRLEELRETIRALEAKRADLAAAGKGDQAEEVGAQIRRIAGQLAELERHRPGQRDADRRPDAPDVERRMQHLRAAAENLRAAGLPERAEALLREAEALAGGRAEAGRRVAEERRVEVRGEGERRVVLEPRVEVRPGGEQRIVVERRDVRAEGHVPHPPELMQAIRELNEQVRLLRSEVEDLRAKVNAASPDRDKEPRRQEKEGDK
jgi:beta-lactamase regulating signal transducer with metallopeptidase domain